MGTTVTCGLCAVGVFAVEAAGALGAGLTLDLETWGGDGALEAGLATGLEAVLAAVLSSAFAGALEAGFTGALAVVLTADLAGALTDVLTGALTGFLAGFLAGAFATGLAGAFDRRLFHSNFRYRFHACFGRYFDGFFSDRLHRRWTCLGFCIGFFHSVSSKKCAQGPAKGTSALIIQPKELNKTPVQARRCAHRKALLARGLYSH